ncbi:MAG: HNH endonuclease signature motif containing protein, partial [Acidimicrobiales bacterium]
MTDALDELLALDPDTLDDAELAGAVVELRRQQARLAAAATRLTAVFEARGAYGDDGSRSCGAWLAHRCRLPIGQARAEAWLGRRLRTMPATAEALAVGNISSRHAAVLASLAGGRTAELFARDEALLVGHAVRRVLEALDRGCGHPSGCDAPIDRTQGDHIHPWSAGGTTTPDNGQLRCGYHNRWRWQHPDLGPDPPDAG